MELDPAAVQDSSFSVCQIHTLLMQILSVLRVCNVFNFSGPNFEFNFCYIFLFCWIPCMLCWLNLFSCFLLYFSTFSWLWISCVKIIHICLSFDYMSDEHGLKSLFQILDWFLEHMGTPHDPAKISQVCLYTPYI